MIDYAAYVGRGRAGRRGSAARLPLAVRRPPDDDVISYLDGNSLGRPLQASADRIAAFVRDSWAGRLIRGWDEEWLDLPLRIGDRLGARRARCRTRPDVIGDSTTVLLYKLARAAIDAAPRPQRDRDRHRQLPHRSVRRRRHRVGTGLSVAWVRTDPSGGIEPDLLARALRERTALVVLSHVAYRSGFLADCRGDHPSARTRRAR